jgi:hypothetical protein
MSEYDDLSKRVAALEVELAEAKKSLDAVKPKEEFKSRLNMEKIDYTENFRLPFDAAQAMARVVPDVKDQKFNPHAWAQTRMYGPGGFGPSPERVAEADREARRRDKEKEVAKKKEAEPAADHRSPQTRIFDAMVDAMVGGPNDTSKLR